MARKVTIKCSSSVASIKRVLTKLQSAFDEMDNSYDELLAKYGKEFTDLCDDIEIFVRELDSELN